MVLRPGSADRGKVFVRLIHDERTNRMWEACMGAPRNSDPIRILSKSPHLVRAFHLLHHMQVRSPGAPDFNMNQPFSNSRVKEQLKAIVCSIQ